jgi:hypothetical protein
VAKSSFHAAWLDEYSESRPKTAVELAFLIAPLLMASYKWSQGATSTEVFAWMGLTLIVAVVGLTYHSRRMWKRQQDELDYVSSTTPRLELVHPCSLCDRIHNNIRVLRVGVRNSSATADGVAVRLAELKPRLESVTEMHELQATHRDSGVSRVTVNKSDEPLIFFDVFYQQIASEDGEVTHVKNGVESTYTFKKGQALSLSAAVARGNRAMSLDVDEYLVWLAIDGAGAEKRRKFVLRRNASGQYDMAVAVFN